MGEEKKCVDNNFIFVYIDGVDDIWFGRCCDKFVIIFKWDCNGNGDLFDFGVGNFVLCVLLWDVFDYSFC